jgi:hypothetical protein
VFYIKKEKEMQVHQILKLELEQKLKSADVKKKKKKKITYESDSDSASSSSSKEVKKEKSKKIAKKKSKAKKSDKGKTTKKRVAHKVDAVASPIARMAEWQNLCRRRSKHRVIISTLEHPVRLVDTDPTVFLTIAVQALVRVVRMSALKVLVDRDFLKFLPVSPPTHVLTCEHAVLFE